ncbi:hypothetical protein I5Q34_16080 [Streptomyces sp. AV19]|uniref:hypothetical protein n=1 Tax=Streptomyces sp. AV19 TaxID=2793068 RepID=UPI0018FE4C76|nr:hypothetical protein [Streptomyces sp. AV19]MBH1935771.1 hypothetical protein [Streptomyces sp. AV19]MDG4535955.1 hypothetical protein [Streptomyces sp. AV19]
MSDELKELCCELAERNASDGHPLWPVFAALYRLEVGTDPQPLDLFKLDCCPRHF